MSSVYGAFWCVRCLRTTHGSDRCKYCGGVSADPNNYRQKDSSPSNQQLKLCPFCGAAAREFMWPNHYGCSDEQCGAYAANLTAEQWNKRPADETKAEQPK